MNPAYGSARTFSSGRGGPFERPAAFAPVAQPEQADQALGVGKLAVQRRRLQLLEAGLGDVEKLAGVEPALAGHEAAREPDLDAFGRVGDGVVRHPGTRPLGGAVAGFLE